MQRERGGRRQTAVLTRTGGMRQRYSIVLGGGGGRRQTEVFTRAGGTDRGTHLYWGEAGNRQRYSLVLLQADLFLLLHVVTGDVADLAAGGQTQVTVC